MLAARRRENILVATRDILRTWKSVRVSVASWKYYEQIIGPKMLQFNCITSKKYGDKIKV